MIVLENPPLEGTTVFGNANGTAGNSLLTLSIPRGVTISSDDSMVISDQTYDRVLRVANNTISGVIVANSTSGAYTRRAILDSSLLNLYFMQTNLCAIRKSYNGSFNSTIIFGGECFADSGINGGNGANFCMDSADNFYISDYWRHQVIYWLVHNATAIVIAGIPNVSGSDSQHLNNPLDVAVNDTQGVIYVVDSNNHRIMRYIIGSSNGTVVAGGNGLGNARK